MCNNIYRFPFLSPTSWNEFRAKQAIDKIVGEGLAWVDEQSDEKSYWFPSLFPKRQQATAQS